MLESTVEAMRFLARNNRHIALWKKEKATADTRMLIANLKVANVSRELIVATCKATMPELYAKAKECSR